MIETAAERRAVGDWRGACAAADVDIFFNPDSVRRVHGTEAAESLAADLCALAPDLLRWHLPRCGHGAGRLLEGLLVPLAGYCDQGTRLVLAAATPGFALAAGERIVLVLLEGRDRGGRATADPATSAVLGAVHRRSAERYDLRRHRMFWDAGAAPRLGSLCRGGGDGDEAILLMQDQGRAIEAWTAAGWDVTLAAPAVPATATRAAAGTVSGTATGQERERQRLRQWLATLPAQLPGLAGRIREALPGAEQAVIRCGNGTLVLSGVSDAKHCRAEIVPPRRARALRGETAVVPDAAWARPIDADLLRLGVLAAHELHPLVASALTGATAESLAAGEWRYSTTLGVEAQYADTLRSGRSTVLVRCGEDLHRVARLDGRWQAVDHHDHAAREMLLGRLGGPLNPCRTAAQHLGNGRHVIELVARLLEHGRAAEATALLREHADTVIAPEQYALPDGGTVGQALDQLRQNVLRLELARAGAAPPHDARSSRVPPPGPRPRRPRKGQSARPGISR